MNRPEILDTAKSYVTADRNATHGDPEDNFRTIAEYWSAYLRAKYLVAGEVDDLNPADIAAMMVLMKVSRLATSPGQEDHWIDIAGYAACGGEVATRVRAGS